MEDSHLLLEQPAHSAKEENLPLAHARHGTAPYTPLQRLLALRAPHAGQTGEDTTFRHGTRRLNPPHTLRGHFLPRKKTLFLKKKSKKNLFSKDSPHSPQLKLGLLVYRPSLVGRTAPLRSSGMDPRGGGCRSPTLGSTCCRNCSRDTALRSHHPTSRTQAAAIPSTVSPGLLEEASRGEEVKTGKQRYSAVNSHFAMTLPLIRTFISYLLPYHS